MIFGIGTDIIEVARVERRLARTPGLAERLFTAREIDYCRSKRPSAQHYAARFAAKEAFLKALGTGLHDGFRFVEIEITNDPLGKPSIQLHGRVARFCQVQGISAAKVSLSHLGSIAQALIVLETAEPARGEHATDR